MKYIGESFSVGSSDGANDEVEEEADGLGLKKQATNA